MTLGHDNVNKYNGQLIVCLWNDWLQNHRSILMSNIYVSNCMIDFNFFISIGLGLWNVFWWNCTVIWRMITTRQQFRWSIFASLQTQNHCCISISNIFANNCMIDLKYLLGIGLGLCNVLKKVTLSYNIWSQHSSTFNPFT